MKMQVDTALTSHSCAPMRKILQNRGVLLNTWNRYPVPKLLFKSYGMPKEFCTGTLSEIRKKKSIGMLEESLKNF